MRLVYRMLCEVKEKVKDRTKQSLGTKRREGEEGVIGALLFCVGYPRTSAPEGTIHSNPQIITYREDHHPHLLKGIRMVV